MKSDNTLKNNKIKKKITKSISMWAIIIQNGINKIIE